MRRSSRSRRPNLFPEDSEDDDDGNDHVFDSRTKQTMNANFAAIRSNGITASLNYLAKAASTIATTKATATATANENENENENGNENENENGILLSRTPTEEHLVSPAQLLMSTSKSFGLRLLSKIALPTSLPTSPSSPSSSSSSSSTALPTSLPTSPSSSSSSSSSSSNAMQHRHHAKLTNDNDNDDDDDDDDVHSDLTYEEEVNQLKQDNVFNQNLSSDEGK